MRKIMMRAGAIGAAALFAMSASAQIPFTVANAGDPLQGPVTNSAFPPQNINGPKGVNYQVNYPYPGQCLADVTSGVGGTGNRALFPTLQACAGGSFACASGYTVQDPAALPNLCAPLNASCTPGAPPPVNCLCSPIANQSAGGWAACGAPFGFKVLAPVIPNVSTVKFAWELLNPPDYTPDKVKFPGADYYEIGLHEAWGFSTLAAIGLFPNPAGIAGAAPVPDGMQWTGLTCNVATGCTCPAGLTPAFEAAYCRGGVPGARLINFGDPLYTPIWGVGQINGPLTGAAFWPGKASPWSKNNYFATWPSISIRATRGTPVIVKWVNEFPNSHVLCPHAEAADWPCSIDRTFMGVKARIDPATSPQTVAFAEGVNQYGSPQQPDNSWVTHLHGGEIPPGTDGFAEKWFGNAVTAPIYTPTPKFVNPPFEYPEKALPAPLVRPAGNFDTYTYPMVQEEATIWFHDHTLGKTHHNVIAGPAGFFPVKEPAKHGQVSAGTCIGGNCLYTWLDPVTEIRGPITNAAGQAAGVVIEAPKYDLFLAIQDRAFNDDGSINFSNGLGQTIPPPPAILPAGYTPVTNGVNPLVHPTWVPEYFGDHALVNGVLWPKKATEPGWYRMRIVDGSDSRCYTLGFQTMAAGALPPAPGAPVSYNTPFYVIANDQGYLASPVLAPGNRFTMCPGERYELLVNFGALPGRAAGAAATVYMVNNAPAPFPAGISPQRGFAPDLNVIMRFDVTSANGQGLKSCGALNAPPSLSWTPGNRALNELKTAAGFYQNACMPLNPALAMVDPAAASIRPVVPFPAGSIVRQVYLNEKVDGVTLTPLGMQLNGVPFEYKVTETPKVDTREIWQFINLTVDAHPMHPHLVKHQIVQRQRFNVGAYKAALCGSATCQPGPAPGGEMQVVPDVTPMLSAAGATAPVTNASVEGGFKDATQVPPAFVTTIVADWGARWTGAGTVANPAGIPTAPGTSGCVWDPVTNTYVAGPGVVNGCVMPFVYETVTSGPFVWHCHINSHEDSEMMRTSLVVP